MMLRVIVLMLLGTAQAAFAQCGASPDLCTIPTGSYHAVLPATGDDAPPAVVFMHGWGGDGAGTLSNRGMVDALTARGYAVIALDGSPREGRNGRGWNFRADQQGRDDGTFAAAAADDAAARFGLDRARMVLAGFSVGGSMVSYVACATPDAFSAYAPISGNFWRPHPEACAGPVRMFHIHGWTDGTVPLEGRMLRGGAIQQGDVFGAMEIWRATNGCAKPNPDGFATVGDTQIRRWDESCAPGSSLALALHAGGHKVPKGWADLMLDWVEGLSPSQ